MKGRIKNLRWPVLGAFLALPSCAALQSWDFSSGAARTEEEQPDSAPMVTKDAGGDAAEASATGDGGLPPIVLVQSNGRAVDGLTTKTFDVTLAEAQHAGDTIVIAIGWYTDTARATVTSVTDSNGNTYTPVSAPVTRGTGSDAFFQLIELATVTKPGPANAKVIVNWDVNADSPDLRVAEFSGIAASSPVEGTISATGNGKDIDSGALTTTSPRALLFAASTVFGEVVAGDPTYPNVVISSQTNVFQWKVVPPGTYTATAQQRIPDSELDWVTQLVAFR